MNKFFIFLIFFISSLGFYGQNETAVFSSPDSLAGNGRSMPSPFPSPPFPMSDWSGGPIIGEPMGDAPDYLMKAIQKASKKAWLAWKKTGIKIYGWIDPSMNYSTSKTTNSPMCYDIIPNRPVLDQFVLRFERDPNTEQLTHMDWGFLFDNIYGIDYRYTIAKGYFSNQLLKYNHVYGDDPAQMYGLLYVPHVAEGMLIKVGRFISPADIEAQWAPDNYLFSHSLMFTFDPYTFTGINTTIRLSLRIQIELGIHAGNDMAPWSNSAQPNGLGMIRWLSKNNKQSIYGGVNAIGSGQFKNGHDDLQMLVAVWGIKFSERVHMMTETYYLWEFNAALGGTAIYGPLEYGQGGGMGSILPGLSQAIGFVNYFQILLNPKNYISIRNDALDDVNGWRSGYATWYSSHTIGWVHHFTDYLTMRPEIRYEQAWNDHETPYDGGTKKYQFTIASDLIIRF